MRKRMSNIKNIRKNKWIKWGVIPFLLLCLWFALTFWYILIFDQSLLVISYNHSAKNFNNITHKRLLSEKKLTGEFIAQDDNLGTVSMRFMSFQRIPYDQEDILVFRLKEKGQKNWYYENNYRSGLIFDVPFLPFGFPIINNSKGKVYVFELESLKGNMRNGVVLSNRSPFLASKYKSDKSQLLAKPEELGRFILKKFINSFNTIDILYSSFVFALPFLFYILWSPFSKYCYGPLAVWVKKTSRKSSNFLSINSLNYLALAVKYFFAVFLLIAVFVDILYLQTLDYLLYLVIVVLWIVILMKYHLGTRHSLVVGLFILCFSPFALIINNNAISEQSGAWAFMFLLGGLLMELLPSRKKIYS